MPPPPCGGCFYDLSLKLKEKDEGKDIGLKSIVKECSGPEREMKTIFIPLSKEKTGIKCAYISDAVWEGQITRICRELNTPCEDKICCVEDVCVEANDGGSECNGNLVCKKVDEGQKRCLATCEKREDCAHQEINDCKGGLCVITEKW